MDKYGIIYRWDHPPKASGGGRRLGTLPSPRGGAGRKGLHMIYENLVMDEERALYGIEDAQVKGCRFEGPADGESALKESRKIEAEDCLFALRYPLWHVHKGTISHSQMTQTCRAALWYDEDVKLQDCQMDGVKALRECDRSELVDCQIQSEEFGWFCRGIRIQRCTLTSAYAFLHSRDLEFDGLEMTGKYSFQYVENAVIRNSVLDTKDAFWHSKNITVVDSVVKGEYLGWYSENLHLIRCKISGTQPLCYAKGLVLEDCEMEGADLSFENSQVEATVKGEILSVKNPYQGSITADRIGEIIQDAHQWPGSNCRIIQRG